MRLLPRAIEVAGLALALALFLVEDQIHRNEVARRSHAKTWRARHKRVKLQGRRIKTAI